MTTHYNVRKLLLAVVDDDQIKPIRLVTELIDFVDFPPNGYGRLSRLVDHLENAAHYKEVTFDLLSIDVNFQEDEGDPMHPAPQGRRLRAGEAITADLAAMTASGLYHGLALLARRAPTDELRNQMPLSWHLRSAAPDAFKRRTDLRNDALRGYAFLRALLARPRKGESFKACIIRERREAGLDGQDVDNATLLEVVLNDLVTQTASAGQAEDIIKRLLPRWRRAFMIAVSRGQVVLHLDELQRQLDQVKKVEIINIAKPLMFCVPVRGRRRPVAYGLSLASIMADCEANGAINVTRTKSAIADALGKATSVLGWMENLLSATNEGPRNSFERVAARFEQEMTRENGGRVGALWSDYCTGIALERCVFLYILMRTRLWVRRDDMDQRDPPDLRRAGIAGPSIEESYKFASCNEHTFRRPLRDNRTLVIKPSELRVALRQALTASHQGTQNRLYANGWWHDWLRETLQNYCMRPEREGGLNLTKARLKVLAPGLLNSAD